MLVLVIKISSLISIPFQNDHHDKGVAWTSQAES